MLLISHGQYVFLKEKKRKLVSITIVHSRKTWRVIGLFVVMVRNNLFENKFNRYLLNLIDTYFLWDSKGSFWSPFLVGEGKVGCDSLGWEGYPETSLCPEIVLAAHQGKVKTPQQPCSYVMSLLIMSLEQVLTLKRYNLSMKENRQRKLSHRQPPVLVMACTGRREYCGRTANPQSSTRYQGCWILSPCSANIYH